jgi:hypothetical protein
MNTAQEILFGGFPRTVAYADETGLKQFFVHSEGEWDVFFEHNQDQRNLYSSTCRFRSDMRHVLDEVFLDLDSPMKNTMFDDDVSDIEKINRMREDKDLANKVLGMVWDDAQKLVRACKEDEIPTICVFSGLGVHVHMLYQDRVEPVKEKVSISNYYIETHDLKTSDRKVLTDTRRVLRIPNSRRFDDGESGDVYCIPITEDEVLENDIHDLLQRCKKPKDIPFHDRYKYENRPKMSVKEGYEEVDIESQGTVPMHGQDIDQNVDELSEWIVRNNIPLPCVRERFLGANPHHMVRFNGTVLLFQAGFSLEEVRSIIRGIGWVDYNEQITKTMTKSIWNGKYSENSCSTLTSLGLCVYGPDFEDFSNDATDCDTYNWAGQQPRY